MGTELRTPDSAFRMHPSPRDVSPVINPHREQDQALQLGVRSASAVDGSPWGKSRKPEHSAACERFLFLSPFSFPSTLPGAKRLRCIRIQPIRDSFNTSISSFAGGESPWHKIQECLQVKEIEANTKDHLLSANSLSHHRLTLMSPRLLTRNFKSQKASCLWLRIQPIQYLKMNIQLYLHRNHWNAIFKYIDS